MARKLVVGVLHPARAQHLVRQVVHVLEDQPYKVTDRDGMYAYVASGSAISFRFDYRKDHARGLRAMVEADGLTELSSPSCRAQGDRYRVLGRDHTTVHS